MRFVNTSAEHVVSVPALGISVGPGEECDVADGYARPRQGAGGGRYPSIIEQLAPQLVPADILERQKWLGLPEHPRAPEIAPPVKATTLVAEGVPEGVAEQREAFSALPAAEAAAERPARKGRVK